MTHYDFEFKNTQYMNVELTNQDCCLQLKYCMQTNPEALAMTQPIQLGGFAGFKLCGRVVYANRPQPSFTFRLYGDDKLLAQGRVDNSLFLVPIDWPVNHDTKTYRCMIGLAN